MARPTIAVIIPTHPARARNGLLQQAVGSVWAQTLQPDAVHIAVDHDREGPAVTRQRALMAATTDYVAFLDSDDLFLPRHLELLLAHITTTGADMCYSWFRVLQVLADGRSAVLEDDPVFPVTHYLNEFDPADPIETTITTMVRTDVAQKVGFRELDRGQTNSGEDRYFTLALVEAGATIRHLRRKTWLWRHWQLPDGTPGNTSGKPGRGDAG